MGQTWRGEAGGYCVHVAAVSLHLSSQALFMTVLISVSQVMANLFYVISFVACVTCCVFDLLHSLHLRALVLRVLQKPHIVQLSHPHSRFTGPNCAPAQWVGRSSR